MQPLSAPLRPGGFLSILFNQPVVAGAGRIRFKQVFPGTSFFGAEERVVALCAFVINALARSQEPSYKELTACFNKGVYCTILKSHAASEGVLAGVLRARGGRALGGAAV